MKKYAVCIDKILFCIYPCIGRGCGIKDVLAEIPVGSYAVLLSTSLAADFSAECYSDDGRIMKEPHLPMSALSFFFKEARGFPRSEVDIEYFGKIYTLDISNIYGAVFNKIPDKSKCLLSKTMILQDGTAQDSFVIKMDRAYRVIVVGDASGVRDSSLRSLVLRDGLAVSNAIAVSRSSDVTVKAAYKEYPLEAVAASLSALMLSGKIYPEGEYTACIFGASHRVRICGTSLSFVHKVQKLC